jgi:DNA-binding NarL/FixJ family response regulator
MRLSSKPSGHATAGEAGNSREALDAYTGAATDVTLMDSTCRGPTDRNTKVIIRQDRGARIIALTSYYGDNEIYRALEAGVRGYILKETVHTEVVRAIRTVHAGKRLVPAEITNRLNEHFPPVTLTKREIEVLELAAQGLGNKEIGDQLGTTPGTAKMHLQNVFSKLGASDRTHALAISIRRGIIHLDP